MDKRAANTEPTHDRTGMRRGLIFAGATAVAIGVVAALVWMNSRDTPVPDATTQAATYSHVPSVCDDIGLATAPLDEFVVRNDAAFCFEVTEATIVSMGAIPDEGAPSILFDIRTRDGLTLGYADGDFETSPEITSYLPAGVYIGTVVNADGSNVGEFLLYSYLFPAGPNDGLGEIYDDRPVNATQEDCLDGTYPLLELASITTLDRDTVAVCIEVTETTFVKMGVASNLAEDDTDPDRNLTLYRALDGQAPEFVRSIANGFGLDPEMSVSLEPGIYVLAVRSWDAFYAGTYDLYLDNRGEYLRSDHPVTAGNADLTWDTCVAPGMTVLTPGDMANLDGERSVFCLSVTEGSRIDMPFTSLAGQDLVVEIIGFDSDNDNEGFQVLWVDDALPSQSPDVVVSDPHVDTFLPAGVYLVVVSIWGDDDEVADFDVSVFARSAEYQHPE